MTRAEDKRKGIGVEISLLTGGQDRHYAYGLAMALAAEGVGIDIIGSNEVDCPEFHDPPRLNFFNLRGDVSRGASLIEKIVRVSRYYVRLLLYAAKARPRLFHILWNNRFETFDRTVVMAYYRLLGKKIVLTAHNTNIAKRDSSDSLINRLSLRVQYRLAHHIFVHTPAMKSDLLTEFNVRDEAVTVIPYGMNNAVPDTRLSTSEAKRRFDICCDEKTILFFGAIAPYKGLDILVEALRILERKDAGYKLIIAGKPKGGCDGYLRQVQSSISELRPGTAIQKIEFVPDEEAEAYFKAADLLVLPYRAIFQSGILFLGYNFGLPVVATDVGSLKDDIWEGHTGFLCQPESSEDLAKTIEAYFQSDLCKHLEHHRAEIREYARARHSWDIVGDQTLDVYSNLIAGR